MEDRLTITNAIQDDAGELETMRVLQLKLARTIDESSSGRDIAALSRQLQSVTVRIRELEELEDQSDSVLDQIVSKHRGRAVRDQKGRSYHNEQES